MKTITLKLKFFLILLYLFFGLTTIYAQSISTGTPSPTQICRGSSITVPFETTGSFQEGKIFKLQLSSSSGNFSSSFPNYIGELQVQSTSSSNSVVLRTITGQISSTISTSSNYKVRVVYFGNSSFSPSTTGTINSQKIKINALPTATIKSGGATTFCQGASVVLNANTGAGLTYQWKNNGTNISGATAASYTASSAGSYTVVVTNSNGCSKTSTSTTVTVNPLTTPTFTQVSAICSGATLSALPTTSNNSIAGSWSPALNNTTTTTYTFTPTSTASPTCARTTTIAITVNALPTATITAGGATTFCQGASVVLNANTGAGLTYQWKNNGTNISGATAASYTASSAGSYTVVVTNSNGCSKTSTATTVTVNPLTTPTFTQVSAICSGGSFALPTISENGISGSWSPELNFTETTTYTFTPAIGTCANTSTMTVVVNPIITPTFNQVASICSGGSFELPTISENGISGTWSPELNFTETTTYTFTPAIGTCANTSTMTVVVNPIITSTFNQVASICSGGSFELPTISENGISGTWSPELNFTETTTYTFTPTIGTCANTSTMTVVVNPIITPTFNQVASICSGGSFELPTISENGISGTWSPELNFTETTTYTFTPAIGTCANTSTMSVVVNPIITPTFNQVAAICSGGSFELPTISENGISGTWSPELNFTETTTYTFTPAIGTCANTSTMTVVVNPIITPTFNQVASICSGGSFELPTISENGISGTWSPELNFTETTTYTFTPAIGTCANTSTMTVVVNPIITPTFNQVASICSGGSFELPTISENGISGTWSPELNFTETTTYTFTPAIGTCANTSTMTVVVNPIITPTFNQVASICSGGSFELPTISENGISGTWSPELNFTETTTYTFTPAIGTCANTSTTTVVVNPIITPTFNQVAVICSGGSFEFPTISENGISGTWSPELNFTETTTYTFTPAIGTCANTSTMTVVVNPIITNDTTVVACSTYTWPVNNQTYSASGNYSFFSDCILSTLSLTITDIDSLESPSLIDGQTIGLCINGNSNPTYTITPIEGATSYEWIAPQGTEIVSGQGTTSVTLNILPNFIGGNLSVSAVNPCVSSQPKLLFIRSVFYTPLTPVGPTSGLCPQGVSTAVFNAAIVSGITSYIWTAPEGTSIISGQGSSTIELNISENFSLGSLKLITNNVCGSSAERIVFLRSILSQPGLITGTAVGLCPQGISTVTYSIAAQAGAISYTWTTPLGTTIQSGQGTNSIELTVQEGFTLGNLSVVANTLCGSSVARTLTIRSTLAQPGVISGTTIGLCTQGISSATYSIAAVAGATSYTWTAPAGTSIISGQGSNSIELSILEGFSTGNLSVVANNSCGSSSPSTLSIRSTLSQLSAISGTLVGLCPQEISSLTYSVLAQTGASSYTWTAPVGTTIESGQGTNSIILSVQNNFSFGNLSVTSNNQCGSSLVRVISIRSTPLIPGVISGSVNNLCPNGINNPTYSIAPVSGASSYTWTAPVGTSIISGQGTTSVTLEITNSFVSGTLSVVANNLCGTNTTKTLALSSTPTSPGTITGTTSNICSNGINNPTYTIAAVAGASSYTWTAPSGTTIVSGQGTTAVTLNVSGSFVSGNLSVIANNGCGSSVARTLALTSIPVAPGTITGTTNNLCTNGVNNPTYTIASVAGASSYTWTAPTGTIIVSGQGTTAVTLIVTGNFVSGTLSVIANNSCGSSTSKTLALTSIPTSPGTIIGTTNNLCPNGIINPTYSIAAVSGASSYTWTAPAGTTIASGQGTTSVTLEVSSSFSSGTLSVIANNACSSSVAKTLALSNTPLTPTSITGSTTPCGTVTYTCATVAQAVSYTWTVPTGMEITAGQGTNCITVNIIASSVTGNITARASNNCKTGNTRSLAVNSCNFSTRMSEVSSVQPINENEVEVIVFPNPTNEIVNVQLSNEFEENIKIELINLIGQKVSELVIQKGNISTRATLEGMPSGIYLLQASKSDGTLFYTTKILKQ